MTNLLRQILDCALFTTSMACKLAFVPQYTGEDNEGPSRSASGCTAFSPDAFPKDCKLLQLPSVEALPSGITEAIPTVGPVAVFVAPGITLRRHLPDRMRAQFPGMDLAEITLTLLAEIVAPGSLIWASLPQPFLSSQMSRMGRERIRKLCHLRLVVAADNSAIALGMNINSQFRMCGVLLEKGASDTVTRLFKCPLVTADQQCLEVISDLRRLLRSPGGKTQYGYVLREGIPGEGTWLYEAYHPDIVRREQDLAHLGGIQRIGDLFDAIRGIHPVFDAILLLDVNSNQGVAVLEARNIQPDGSIEFDDVRNRATVPPERQLRPGDICVRAIRSSQNTLTCAIIEPGMPTATVSQSVIVLRPRNAESARITNFLQSYLSSSACLSFLSARGLGLQVVASKLLDLPIPVADEPLRLAVESLGHAAIQFREWADELEAARGSLFDSQSARDARLTALSMGRLAKQRYEAAALVGDFRQRVRTRFPHPIAFRWRTVESQHANLEGYIQILECAEVAVTYLAVMALILAKSVDKRIPWLSQLSKRVSTTGHGTNMGDWISILQDVRGSVFAAGISDAAPFVEVTRFQADKQVEESLKKLAEWRNDQSHGRGPKGSAVETAFLESKQHLETFLQGIEFVSDYPLRFIEETRRDTFRRMTTYSFRELMGDHALVPIAHGETPDAEVEAKSLYLHDRSGRLHLLRPLLIGRDCPVCHSWGTFFLDTLEKKDNRRAERIVIKSMEHGHTCDDLDLVAAFRHWGMIV